MAVREFRCKNYGICDKADSREIISIPDGAPAVCPECKRPLEAAVSGGGSAVGNRLKVPIILALVVIAILAGGYWLMRSKGGSASVGGDIPGRSMSRPLRVGVVTWPGYAGGIVA